MENLTKKQANLLKAVRENSGKNTHCLAQALGHLQAYESHLAARLFRLAKKGVVRFEERKKGRVVTERRWYAN